MTNEQVKADIAANLPDNTSGLITPAKLRTELGTMVDYSDTAAAAAVAALFAAAGSGPGVVAGDIRGYHAAAQSAATGTGRLSVLYFGDSLISRATDVVGAEIVARFQNYLRFGDNTNYTGGVLWTPSGGAYELDGTSGREYSYAEWPTGRLYHMPVGGSIKSMVVRGTSFKVCYKTAPGYGSLLVETSQDNTNWTTEATLDCNSAASTAIHEITKTWSAWGYYIRLTAQTAACRFAWLICDRSGVGRVRSGSLYRGGLSLADAVTCHDAAIQPVLNALVPDLVFVLTDDTSALYDAFLPTLKRWIATANPKASVVLIGNGPKAIWQGGDAASIAQCATLRAYAAANNWSFVDLMKILVSYDEVTALGWQGDGLHLDAAAYSFAQTVMARSLSLVPQAARIWTGNISAFDGTTSQLLRKLQFTRDPLANGVCGWIGARENDGAPLRIVPTRELEVSSTDEQTVHFCISNNLAIRKHQLPQDIRLGSQTAPGISSGAAAPTTGTYVAGSICINTAPADGSPSYWQCTAAGTPGTWVAHNL